MIDFGIILRAYFKKNRTRKVALARLMAVSVNTLNSIQKSESIQTKRLLELCTHLKHNFFMDIAQQLPPKYSTTHNIFATKDQKIATLEEEIKSLKTERNLLIKLHQKFVG
jgi:DNA-binding Xre family transcriptional regulator